MRPQAVMRSVCSRAQLPAAGAQCFTWRLSRPCVQVVLPHKSHVCCPPAPAFEPAETPGPSLIPAKKSRFRGVHHNSRENKWKAVLWNRQTKERVYVGAFDTEEEAARAYDQAAIIHNTPLGGVTEVNFHKEVPPDVKALTKQYKLGSKQKSSSKYKGVAWFAYRSCWQAVIRIDGRLDALGLFTSEEEAARAVDMHLIKRLGKDKALGRGLNFPIEQYDVESLLADAAREGAASGAGNGEDVLAPAKPPRRAPSSTFKGVYKAEDRWRAEVYVQGMKYSAGYHDSELDAAIARDQKLLAVKGAAVRTTELNFPARRQQYMEEVLKLNA